MVQKTEKTEESVTDADVIDGHPADQESIVEDESRENEGEKREEKEPEWKADLEREREALRQEFEAKFEALKPREEKKEAPKDEFDWETAWIADPKAAKAKLKDEILAEAREEIAKEKREFSAKQAEENFWSEFYRTNDDLNRKVDHKLVNAVLQENLPSLSSIKDPEEISKKLADMTRETILAYSRRGKAKAPQVEGATGGDKPEKVKETTSKVVSLTDTLAERRRAKVKRA